MSEIAKAYIQIVPTTKGIGSALKSAMGGEASSAGKSAGESAGHNFVGAIKGLIAAAGIGALVKSTLDAGGAIQQSFGGLDTIYGEASEAVKNYAREAAAAGISANDYAENAVSFGASLKMAFGGDVTKAAEAANTAILDMADNSAKMGTDIGAVQSAYQGFAKQNYTMLDNLKLGYGGTKSEMERLLADAEKLSGVEYNIDNLGDVYSAIHVIQEDLGLTGVAAAEASTTFTGSFGAMKAALTNFLADLSTGGDVQASMQVLVQTVVTFLTNNLIPMLMSIIQQVPTAVKTLIETAGPAIVEAFKNALSQLGPAGDSIFSSLASTIGGWFDQIRGIIESFVDLAMAIWNTYGSLIIEVTSLMWESIKMIIDGALALIQGIITTFTAILTGDWQTAWEGIKSILDGILNIMLGLITAVTTAISGTIAAFLLLIKAAWETAWEAIKQKLTEAWNSIKATVEELSNGIKQKIDDVKTTITTKVGEAVDYIKSLPAQALEWGRDLIQNFIDGIKEKAEALKDSVANIAEGVKDFLGFSEPEKGPLSNFHTYAPDMMNLFAQGIRDNEDVVRNQIAKSFDVRPDIEASVGGASTGGAVSIVQNIYSQAKTASELMREARYEQERAVLMGV